MKFITIRNVVDKDICDRIIADFTNESYSKNPLGFLDDNEFANTIYESTRSPNLRYNYLRTLNSVKLHSMIVPMLQDMLNVSFAGSINDVALPVFEYKKGGEILAHRGVQKNIDLNKYQSFVAVIQLTQRGVDFEGGRFYINPKAECSSDGKTVTNDLVEDRIYPMLNKGDMCIIHNPSVVHGVDVVTEGRRLTCSFRSNVEQ